MCVYFDIRGSTCDLLKLTALSVPISSFSLKLYVFYTSHYRTFLMMKWKNNKFLPENDINLNKVEDEGLELQTFLVFPK